MLVNGSPTKEFVPSKGLRQGDPLAPFLFLIVAEGLAGVVRNAVMFDWVESVEVGRNKVKVNMLLQSNSQKCFLFKIYSEFL